MKKSMYINKIPNNLILCAQNKTVDGIFKTVEPAFKISDGETADMVCQKIFEILDCYKENVPNIFSSKDFHFVLKLAGVSSLKKFYQICNYSMTIEIDENQIALFPWILAKDRKGHIPLKGKEIYLSIKEKDKLGKYVLEFFQTNSPNLK